VILLFTPSIVYYLQHKHGSCVVSLKSYVMCVPEYFKIAKVDVLFYISDLSTNYHHVVVSYEKKQFEVFQ
jgi:hypothetical protein